MTLVSQKMGIHEWSYDNDISNDLRYRVPLRDKAEALGNVRLEVELGFDRGARLSRGASAASTATSRRCSPTPLCIECDACVDICPMDCITFTENGEEADLRERLNAPALNLTQDLYVSDAAADRPGHGQGRGRLPALRPLRRALPDRRLGHAASSCST